MSAAKKQYSASSEIESLENLVRAGDFAHAAGIISALNRSQIAREDLVRYANLANRVNLGKVAHRFLQPVIRSEKKSDLSASDEEKVEYAEALRSMGLIEEAKEVLSSIDSSKQPMAELRMAFCLMTQWNYSESIPYLKSYIQAVPANEYTHRIAEVNLAAALVIERQDSEALELLKKLRSETSQSGHQLLHSNCLELLTQLYVMQGELSLAEAVLKEAEPSFANARTRYSLYMRKWKTILMSLRMGSVHPELLQCREDAVQDGEWETIRDCDLYIAYLKKDAKQLQYVYYGSPFSSYRKRIQILAGELLQIGDDLIWTQSPSESITEVFNLLEGRFEVSQKSLEPGRLMHRLLILLASDFYRPVSITSAFSELFPDEHYSQEGSANRVVQTVKRLRQWFQNHGEWMQIEEKDGNYWLRARAGLGIRRTVDLPGSSSNAVNWKKLSNQVQQKPFSKTEVCEILNCSPSSANRLLRWALGSNHCETVGKGPNRKYRLSF